jgi:type VI secretion system protein ImpA
VTQFDVDALLAEISADAPCGEDVSYDVAFLELEQLAKGTAETQVGDHIQESEEPDWQKVYRQSLELLERSRDLRLILYLTTAMLCLEGLSGFRNGLFLLRGVVERYWDHLFPQLDPEDDNDPLERMNIIGSLSPSPTMMSDQDPLKFITRLMHVPLCRPQDARLPRPSMRHILFATGEITVSEKEAGGLPNLQLIEAAFEQSKIENLMDTDQTISDCLEHLHALDQMLTDRVGAAAAPNLARLEHLLQQMQAKTRVHLEHKGYGTNTSEGGQPQTEMDSPMNSRPSNSQNPSRSDGTPEKTLSGKVTSNQDVIRALDMIVAYYAHNEPSSPVPLLIKRAKRLVGKSFVDIIKDLSPDAMSQVRQVSGEEEQPED